MFHVSFRYIFGLPPLILVLLPVTSSDCHIKDIDGKAFENVIVISLDKLKAAFLNRAAGKLKQFHNMNISEDFEDHLSKVSEGTLALVNCTSRKEEKSKKDKKKSDPCFLKRLLEEIKTCWNKILMGSTKP
ncbi:interleukin-7 isoform X2 [Dipodomys spectabilis]|uniref:interleukin-7 isoform X2 n=1 Tax=Dipodomys spectabilis TaxID=105255 RepID=UPI001C542EF1|nr:interleukin-7 isoform X2 [Dipodomys spectabilis]